MTQHRRFNARAFIAFCVAGAFLTATVTGIVLYIVPQGRVANWVDWSLLGLTKHDWGNIHILLGLVFIVAGSVHLYFNWKPFRHHLAERVQGHVSLRKEFIAGLSMAVLLIAGAVGQWPGFRWVFELNEKAKSMWVASPQYEPPYGHAEDSTLDVLARRTFIDPGAARALLKEAGFDLLGPRASVSEIARRNGTTPMGLYIKIAGLASPPPAPAAAALTPETIEERFTGTGVGRKTFAQMCAEAGVDCAVARERLKAAGFDPKDDATMRQLGESQGMQPIQVLQLMLLGKAAVKPTH